MTNNDRANPLICVLIIIFASSAWLGSCAITVEMSIFTRKLPEGWALGPIVMVAIQVRI